MNSMIFPGLKTQTESKVRAHELHLGDEFKMLNINYVVARITENSIFYRLKTHPHDLKTNYRFGVRSKQFIIKTAQK